MDYIILFSATLLAVLAVEAYRKPIEKSSIDLISGFTGAFVIGILVFHMLPEVYEELAPRTIGLCIMIGLLIQSILDFYTKGIDHGHTHTAHCTHGHSADEMHPSLTIAMFVSLSMHTFLESIPILSDTQMHSHDLHHGIEIAGVSPLLVGIALHTIPMAMVLYMFIRKSVKSHRKALMLILFFGLMGPLGMFIGAHVSFLHQYYYQMMAVVTGILLHVSSVMLFDCDMAMYGKIKKLSVIVIGLILAMLLTC